VSQLFAEPLRPVAADAQQRVPLPEDLDLDTQINVIPQHDPKDDWNAINNSFGDPLSSGLHSNSTSDLSTLGFDPSVSSTYQSSASRLGSPYILGAAAGSSSSMAGEVILPPEHQIEALPAEFAVGSAFGQRLRKYTTLNQQGASPKTRRRLERERKARLKTKVEILHEVDAPEVFPTKKPSAQAVLQFKDEDDLSKIDLSAPLDPTIDVLPVQQHRVVTNSISSSLPAAAAQQPQTPPSKVVQPVDPIFGKAKRGRKVRRDGQRRAKPTKAKAAAVTGKVGAQLLDLDFGHETLPSPAHSAPSPARLAATSPVPVSSSSPAPASASSSQPQLSFSDPAAPALLTSDSNIQLLFAPQFSPETGKVLVTFGLKNVGKTPLSRFKFGLSGPVLQQAPVSPDFALPPGAECSTQVLFGFDSSQAIATKLPSTLEFATASGSAFMLSFDLSFPCTCFLAPTPISTDRFAAFSASCPALVSKKLRAPAGFAKALESIVAKGHLFVVEKMESAAMCHASGPLGSSLIFLVKRRSPHSVSLEIKSQAPHQAFITILAKEF
ncbi:MAG: hypothetical protein Q8P67_11700, partial [archaeon]|nr:hypothetical protein [archaeon]